MIIIVKLKIKNKKKNINVIQLTNGNLILIENLNERKT